MIKENNEWINEINIAPLIERNNSIKTIYFLYEFLGDDADIESEKYISNLKTYKKINPDWKIEIIRDKTNNVNDYVRNKFPKYLDMYLNYAKDIQRCDIFRYMLIFKEGGVYSDLDVFPKIPLNEIFNLRINNIDLPIHASPSTSPDGALHPIGRYS